MKTILLTMLLFTSMSFAASGGGDVDNGGDELRQLVSRIQKFQARKMRELKYCSLPVETPDDIKTWILNHLSQLADDIEDSPHVWTDQEQATCAITTTPGHGYGVYPIRFSFPTCLKTTNRADAISRLLVHESVHHFGIGDESFADKVANAVIDAKYFPSCPGEPVNSNTRITKSSFGVSCQLVGDKLSCQGHGLDFLPDFSQMSVLDFSVGSKYVCILQTSGINCYSSDREFAKAEIPEGFEILALHGGPYASCFIDMLGVACWGSINYSRIARVIEVKKVAMSRYGTCLLKLNEVSCSLNRQNRFEKVEGLVHPRDISASKRNDTMCVLDDLGAVCFNVGNDDVSSKERITDFDFPTHIVTRGSMSCVIDGKYIKCWSRSGADKNKVFRIALPSYARSISMDSSRICASYDDGKHRCVELAN